MSKYDCARDEVLDVMVMEGWANQSDGNVEAPTGHFACVCNSETELDEVLLAFAEDIARVSDEWGTMGNGAYRDGCLVGHYIVRTNNQGFVSVESFETLAECESAYAQLQNAFYEWDSE
jgi:hypothetical protein